MQPADIFPRIKIVHLADCLAHEGVVARWVDQIAANLLDHGVLKNPIVVTRNRRAGKQIVIDGMHRFAAFRRLEIPDIVAYEVDYDAPTVRLEGWDAVILRPFAARPFLQRCFPTRRGFRIDRLRDLSEAQIAMDRREALIAAMDAARRCYLVTCRGRVTVDRLVQASEIADRELERAACKPIYVADSLALADFHRMHATGLIVRPHYTKREILERTMAHRLFPRKSTRHLIPGRPLRVDVNLTLLRAKIPSAAKNRWLDEHLRWCYESDRIRYYPESVFVFAD